MSDEAPKFGSEPKIHHSTADTRERAYERLRSTGIPAEPARKIADEAVRSTHDDLNKSGGSR